MSVILSFTYLEKERAFLMDKKTLNIMFGILGFVGFIVIYLLRVMGFF